jgi:hypothetical protein
MAMKKQHVVGKADDKVKRPSEGRYKTDKDREERYQIYKKCS